MKIYFGKDGTNQHNFLIKWSISLTICLVFQKKKSLTICLDVARWRREVGVESVDTRTGETVGIIGLLSNQYYSTVTREKNSYISTF